jgi:membrane protease YdiL (CAAX protease family)
LLLTFIVERKAKFYLDVIENKTLCFPIQGHRNQIETGWYRSYVKWKVRLKTENKHWFSNVRERPTRKSQRDIRQRGGLLVVIVVIMILMIKKTIKTLAGYSNSLRTQATRKLTSPSAVQLVQGYPLEYVCRGFVQTQAWRWSAVRLVLPNI